MVLLLIIVLGVITLIVININKKSNEIAETTGKKSSATEETNKPVELEITDNFFIEQTNDVYINVDDYVDKIVKLEGLIYSYEDYSTGNTLYAVVRNTPGCCGNDGLAGLDIRYDGEYPKEDTWVEVTGVIKKETVANSDIPAIQVTSMKEKKEGVTFVTN